jgi:protein-S-isoprenylcysteine O-methyltransferase Ste14
MSEEKPGVKVPPPAIYAVALAAGIGLGYLIPVTLFTAFAWWYAAGVLGAAAAGLAVWALVTFKLADTSVEPWHPARHLVTHGPYAYMRNPMYVALTLLTAALAVGADLPWVLVLLPPAVVATDRLVIAHEEVHLTRKFGDAYRAYCQRVRRWGVV